MPSRDGLFRVGTRTSRLAEIQTGLALDALQTKNPDVRFEVQGIVTHGDRVRNVSIADLGQGAFVKELERALLEKEIDLAVHSLKDLPTDLPPGLCLAAVLPRDDPRDALVSREGRGLSALPLGSRIGTGSPRRGAQILARRPDLEIVLLRGNVDTRVRKVLEGGEADAAVLAVAGLRRLGMEGAITEYLDLSVVLPDIGQGFLAIEAREDDAETLALARTVEEKDARRCADAERAFLKALGGGCMAPLAAYATVRDGELVMEGMVASLDGRRLLRERVEGDLSPAEAALLLWQRLDARGAGEIIAGAEATGA